MEEEYYSYYLKVGSKTRSVIKTFPESPYINPGYV